MIKFFEIGNVFSKKDEKKQITLLCTGPAKELTNLVKKIEIEFGISNLKYQLSLPRPDQLKYFKIKKPVQILEIDFNDISQKAKLADKKYLLPQKTIHFKTISKYPPAVRDLAFIVDRKIPATKISHQIKNTDKSIFIVELFDEFVSDKLGTGKKNLAFHLWFSNQNKTLSDSEVVKIIDKIKTKLADKFGAKIRNF